MTKIEKWLFSVFPHEIFRKIEVPKFPRYWGNLPPTVCKIYHQKNVQ